MRTGLIACLFATLAAANAAAQDANCRNFSWSIGRTIDLFVALAAAATATTTLKVGSGICLVVERDPILLAK